VVEHAEFVAPQGEAIQLASEIGESVIRLLDWAADPAILGANIAVVLVSETLRDLHRLIVESPYVSKIRIDLPTRDEAHEYLQALARELPAFASLAKLSPDAMAERAVGLSRVNLRNLVTLAVQNGKPVDGDYLTRTKRELIEKECFGLLEFIESTRTLDDVSGHEEAKAWLRQEHDSDGTPYRIADDFDSEFFTVKVMDGSGWESVPKRTGLRRVAPVTRGSAVKPTTVILTGALLSQGNGPVRNNFIAAAAASILEAIADPSVGGYQDESCQRQALGMVVGFEARPFFRSVCVSWAAVGESISGDFALYRASSNAGPYEKLDSPGIVALKKSDSHTEYRYIDRPPEAVSTCYYKLERSLGGAAATYGPVSTSL